MVRFPTLVLGATLGLAALGLSATASAGVRFGVDVGLPLPVVAAGPVAVAYHPGPYVPGPYYGPRAYFGAPYGHFGPAWGYAHGPVGPRGPVGGWHGGFASHDGHGWHR